MAGLLTTTWNFCHSVLFNTSWDCFKILGCYNLGIVRDPLIWATPTYRQMAVESYCCVLALTKREKMHKITALLDFISAEKTILCCWQSCSHSKITVSRYSKKQVIKSAVFDKLVHENILKHNASNSVASASAEHPDAVCGAGELFVQQEDAAADKTYYTILTIETIM